jgi:chromate transport protein ChrA
MSRRSKILVLIALLGFIAGIIADLTAEYVFPKLLEIFPEILKVRFILSGLVGAVLAIILTVIWAYATSKEV